MSSKSQNDQLATIDKIRLMQAEGVSLVRIANSCGYTSGVISGYLGGSYKGNVRKLEKAINTFYSNYQKRKELYKYDIVFCDISNARKIFAICQIARLDKKICVVVSESGLGKTAALHEDASRNPGTIMIDVDPTYNPKRLFKCLHNALGRSGKGLLEDIYSDCIDSLKGTDRLIIVDEADLLNHKSIELLRRLHDKAGVGIVLAGMPSLIANIRGIRSEFPQVYTRVGGSMKLDLFSPEDTAKVVLTHIKDAGEQLVQTFHKLSRQNGRHLSMLVFQTIRIAEKNAVPITTDIVKKAVQTIEV